jgi:hypothetical protein
MIRAESPARNTWPAGTVLPRATWAPMLNPRTLRSVPRIWGHSLTSTWGRPRAQYQPSRRRPALVGVVVFFDRVALGIVAGAEEDPMLPNGASWAPVGGYTAAGAGGTHAMSTRRPRSANGHVRLNYRRDRVVQGTPGPSMCRCGDVVGCCCFGSPSAAMRYTLQSILLVGKIPCQSQARFLYRCL